LRALLLQLEYGVICRITVWTFLSTPSLWYHCNSDNFKTLKANADKGVICTKKWLITSV